MNGEGARAQTRDVPRSRAHDKITTSADAAASRRLVRLRTPI